MQDEPTYQIVVDTSKLKKDLQVLSSRGRYITVPPGSLKHPIDHPSALVASAIANPLPSYSSISSSHSCPSIGHRGSIDYCTRCRLEQPNRERMCSTLTSVSIAPLCQLPKHIASQYAEVRQAAQARFIELQEQ